LSALLLNGKPTVSCKTGDVARAFEGGQGRIVA
jgi:hypothetical protein